MSRTGVLVLLMVAALGGWYFFQRYQIEGVEKLSVKPREVQLASSAPGSGKADGLLPPVPAGKITIRIATFNLGPLDQHKMSRPQVVNRLAQVIRRFDIVAMQNIQARNQGIVVQLAEQVNADGRCYHYVVGPNVERDTIHRYSAILFDRASIQVDRSTVGLVDDPLGRLRNSPLVAAFRTRGPEPSQAFTFTLVNVDIDPEQARAELDLLDSVFLAVRGDGRNEDDIILLGTLGADDRHLGRIAQLPGITCAVFGMPTTTRGTESSDNLLFDFRATKEFTGRSGVLDLMRELNLTMQEALETASHLPVWAEFSVYEGGRTGHLTARPHTAR